MKDSNYFISCKDREGKFKHFPVPFEVYTYVKQLEAYIKYPEKSKFHEVYPQRVNGDRSE